MSRNGNRGDHKKRSTVNVYGEEFAPVGKHRNRQAKQMNGERQIMEEKQAAGEQYKMDWFKPTTKQQELIDSVCENDLTLCSASSGCGKTTTAVYQALRMLQSGKYKKILFVKTPNESTDDKIGYLPSSADDKLAPHFEATRGVFLQFMTKAKLELEEKRGRIRFDIPNFIQGSTHDDTIFILDESQSISPAILKLLLERAGENTVCIVLGDKRQRYSKDKRADGFTDLVKMVTNVDEDGRYSVIPTIGYVEMSAKDNMRSALSRLIVSLYEEKSEY